MPNDAICSTVGWPFLLLQAALACGVPGARKCGSVLFNGTIMKVAETRLQLMRFPAS
jgi:hypothetical protein